MASLTHTDARNGLASNMDRVVEDRETAIITRTGWEAVGMAAQDEWGAIHRINTLIVEFRRQPLIGTGNPEPLKGDLTGWWSRRITSRHRLVYRVTGPGPDQALQIAQSRYHY